MCFCLSDHRYQYLHHGQHVHVRRVVHVVLRRLAQHLHRAAPARDQRGVHRDLYAAAEALGALLGRRCVCFSGSPHQPPPNPIPDSSLPPPPYMYVASVFVCRQRAICRQRVFFCRQRVCCQRYLSPVCFCQRYLSPACLSPACFLLPA